MFNFFKNKVLIYERSKYERFLEDKDYQIRELRRELRKAESEVYFFNWLDNIEKVLDRLGNKL